MHATERQRTIKDVVPPMEVIEAYEVQNKEEARLIRDLKRSRQTITVAFEMGDEGNRATLSVRDGPVTTICQFSSEYARILADRLIRVADFMDGAEEAAEKDESNEPPAGASGESAPRESGPVPRPPGL